jgi:hypothetical protein
MPELIGCCCLSRVDGLYLPFVPCSALVDGAMLVLVVLVYAATGGLLEL